MVKTIRDATAHLNAMNAAYDTPWNLSFSYGRALQAAPLAAWAGSADNVPAGQSAFLHRARMNGLATLGEALVEYREHPESIIGAEGVDCVSYCCGGSTYLFVITIRRISG